MSERRYYSQQGEDCLLLEFFGRKPTGFFLDVGAFDGVYLSNSKAFEDAGWTGICVEALPDMAALCRRNRPRSICVEAACVGDGREFVEFRKDPSGILSGIGPDEEAAARIYAREGVAFSGFATIRLPARRLDRILDEALGGRRPEIDFASIDVEGAELDVLAGFDLAVHAPRIVILEANTDGEKKAIDAAMKSAGYRYARSLNWNHFYARDRGDVARLRAIAFEARLERPGNPFGRSFDRVGDWRDTVVWKRDGALARATQLVRRARLRVGRLL